MIEFVDLKTQYQALKPQIQARIDALPGPGGADGRPSDSMGWNSLR